MLNEWQPYCSSRGVGLSDFAKEKAWRPKSLVLEADPPLHDRTRNVLNRVYSRRLSCAICERASPGSGGPGRHAARTRYVRRDRRSRRGLSADRIPRCEGHGAREPALSPALRQKGVQFVRPAKRVLRAAIADAEPVLAWLQEQMQRHSFAPGSFGAVIHAAADSGELTEEEAPVFARSLLTAGVDTSVSGIGAAVYCLARYPGEYAKLRADPTLARAAFEEAVRFETPVQTFLRTTTREVELGGTPIGEGEKVLMFLGFRQSRPAAMGAAGRVRDRPQDCRPCRFRHGHSPMRRAAAGAARGECILGALAARRHRLRSPTSRSDASIIPCAGWRASPSG